MKDTEKKSFFWNTLAGLINAGQSFIYILVIRRICGLEEAGIFSFAFANANLFLCIGKYGMRKYQVTDLNEDYKFKDYFFSRIVTTFFMMVGIIIYLCISASLSNYSRLKVVLLFGVGCLKAVDSFDDVFIGLFQQKKRLDIGARNSCIRNAITIGVIIACIIITKETVISLLIGNLVSLVLLYVLFKKSAYCIEGEICFGMDWKTAGGLLKVNAPMVLGDFLSFYIINAPKYAIDANLSESVQAYYGIISMPVLIIALFSDFIFNPLLVRFSECWYSDKKVFVKLWIRQIVLIFICTVMVIILGGLVGLPILEVIYDVDLNKYRWEFVVLLLGGGFAAVYSFLYSLVTAIRKQACIVPIYGAVTIAVLLFSAKLVVRMGLMGASIIYLVSSVSLTILFLLVLLWNFVRNKEDK